MKWRKPREDLVALLDEVIPQGEAAVEFKPMFGGPCYWSGGNMFAAVHQEIIIVRLGEQDRAELLAEPGAHLFEPMEGARCTSTSPSRTRCSPTRTRCAPGSARGSPTRVRCRPRRRSRARRASEARRPPGP